MPGGSPDRITIVIPHLHQWRQLDDCLESLHSQTLPRDRYDIIVVDNGSTDFETGRQNVSRRYRDVRMVAEREIGPGPARNTGVGDRKSTRLNSSHYSAARMPSSAYKKKNKKLQ